jgi:hypothetical protein
MRSEPETPHVAHGTGKRWLDLTLSLSAMFVSLVSLALACFTATPWIDW